ncbi:MAG TPA: hypothetical protein VKM55_13115 [Candidatus Lokiarchaeia archaeon]|nr:hypothetical protein [Candidatus Lokiarchaeia archaeon]
MKDIVGKHDIIKNPAGATNSASFCRVGNKTISLIAEDVTPGVNYHTCLDALDRIDPRAITNI